jgi:iron transport multicopper oxidase
MYHFWIEGHTMRVDTEELEEDLVSIAVAQRYSILVTARNDTSQNWPMHANLDPDMYDKVPDNLVLNITSTLVYGEGNAMGSDRPTVDAYKYFDDVALVPVVPLPMVEADVTHTLSFDFTTYKDGKNYAAFNSKSYVSPLTPSLLTSQTMLLNETSTSDVYGPNTGAVILNHMDMVEIVINNLDSGSHPIHIHGTQFQIVHKSQDDSSTDPALNPPFTESQANPMRRDTIQIPGGGSSTLRFRADNAGAWFIHCHIDWHLSSGLAAILIEAPDLIQSNIATPQYISDQCTKMGKPISGNAGGVQSVSKECADLVSLSLITYVVFPFCHTY